MPNDLIAVDATTNPPTVHLYIQFVVDTYAGRLLPCFLSDGSPVQLAGLGVYNHIITEFKQKSHCLGFNIRLHLIQNNNTNTLDSNWLHWRYDTVPNPFELGPYPATPPAPQMRSELDAQGSVVYPQLIRPLIRFYIGDGESLNNDFRFRNLNNPYPIFNENAARNRIALNRATGYSQVIQGFEKYYAGRISFFSRRIRAGYLFTDGPGLLSVTFMHELGHVLGLEDRYIEGIDEATAADNILNYVGRPARSVPPLSRQYINSVLKGGASGPDPDPDYDPQNNLMSSRSYRLSTYQKGIISGALIENEFTTPYVKEDAVVLLSLNGAARRPPGSILPDKPGPNDPVGTCRMTETPYFPSAVEPAPGTGLDRVTFVRPDGTTGNHNAFFRTGPGSPLSLRYDGDTAVLAKLMKGLAPINGVDTWKKIFIQLRP